MEKVIVQAARRKPHCSPARLCILPAAGNSIYEPLSGCIGTPSWSSQLFELTGNDVKGTEVRLNRQCSRSQESEDRSAIVYSKIDTSAPSSLRSARAKAEKTWLKGDMHERQRRLSIWNLILHKLMEIFEYLYMVQDAF